MTQAQMDLPLLRKSCPAWIDANDNAKGYYRVDYQGTLLAALTSGDVEHRLSRGRAQRSDRQCRSHGERRPHAGGGCASAWSKPSTAIPRGRYRSEA